MLACLSEWSFLTFYINKPKNRSRVKKTSGKKSAGGEDIDRDVSNKKPSILEVKESFFSHIEVSKF